MLLRQSKSYDSWAHMKARCGNKKNNKYPRYGGRGIAVCKRWMRFKNFLEDMGEKPNGTSIDRIDNDGNYEPSNCRWATPSEQANNKSNNRVISFYGKSMSVSGWAKELGIPFVTLRMRLHRGWSIKRSFEEPLRVWPSQRSE